MDMFGGLISAVSMVQNMNNANKQNKIALESLALQKEDLQNKLDTKQANQDAFNNASANLNVQKEPKKSLVQKPKLYTSTQQQYMV